MRNGKVDTELGTTLQFEVVMAKIVKSTVPSDSVTINLNVSEIRQSYCFINPNRYIAKKNQPCSDDRLTGSPSRQSTLPTRTPHVFNAGPGILFLVVSLKSLNDLLFQNTRDKPRYIIYVD